MVNINSTESSSLRSVIKVPIMCSYLLCWMPSLCKSITDWLLIDSHQERTGTRGHVSLLFCHASKTKSMFHENFLPYRYLLHQLWLAASHQQCIFSPGTETGKWKLKPNIIFIFFSSHTPCEWTRYIAPTCRICSAPRLSLVSLWSGLRVRQ